MWQGRHTLRSINDPVYPRAGVLTPPDDLIYGMELFEVKKY